MKEQIFERFSPGTAYTENMTRLFPLLAGLLLFPVFQTEAAEKYSIIPEPEKTEQKRNATRTLKLLSDKTSPSLGKDAYRLAVTPQGVHLASGGREGRMYGLVTSSSSRTSWRHSRRASPAASSRTSPATPGAA